MKYILGIFLIGLATATTLCGASTVSVSADGDTGALKKPENFFDANADKIAEALEKRTPTALMFHFDHVPKGFTDFELKAAVTFDGSNTEGYAFGFYSADPERQIHTWQVHSSSPQVFITDSGRGSRRQTVLVPENSSVELSLASPWSRVGSLTVIVFDGLDNPNLQWVFHWLGDQDANGNPIWRRVFPRPLFSDPNLSPKQQ